MSTYYHVKEWVPGRWLVVDEAGHPLYDTTLENRRQARDKPVVFLDPDSAQAAADVLNKQDEHETSE